MKIRCRQTRGLVEEFVTGYVCRERPGKGLVECLRRYQGLVREWPQLSWLVKQVFSIDFRIYRDQK